MDLGDEPLVVIPSAPMALEQPPALLIVLDENVRKVDPIHLHEHAIRYQAAMHAPLTQPRHQGVEDRVTISAPAVAALLPKNQNQNHPRLLRRNAQFVERGSVGAARNDVLPPNLLHIAYASTAHKLGNAT